MLAHIDHLRRLAVFLGWGAIGLIIASTLSPIDLRPHLPGMGPDGERFLAFVAAGALLSFAYPARRWLVLTAIVIAGMGLEWVQTLEATRHGRPHDAAIKVVGALLGTGMALAFDWTVERLRRAA